MGLQTALYTAGLVVLVLGPPIGRIYLWTRSIDRKVATLWQMHFGPEHPSFADGDEPEHPSFAESHRRHIERAVRRA
jgi:hypothetical protein